jgi:type III restriction enzyme
MKTRRDREGDIYNFSIPDPDEFSDNTTEIATKKNIYDKYYRKNNAPKTTEIPFEEYLEAHENVDWWYNNGERMRKYFAVPYFELDERAKSHRASFYPDYIVKFTDGTVGIFDTKSGRTAEDKHASQKANALQDYLRKYSDEHLWGGLVIPDKLGWQLQADALTHKMAKVTLDGFDFVGTPDIAYSETAWQDIDF